jgi:hypothetical protein
MVKLNHKELHQSGELARSRSLHIPIRQDRCGLGKDSAPTADRVLPESKEFLAGFWIVDVKTPERERAIAARV